MITTFTVSDKGPVQLLVKDEAGRILQEIPEVVTSRRISGTIMKSRRHLYRLIKKGLLAPVAKFSGELFFDKRDLDRLKSNAGKRWAALPHSMAPLFPEYDLQRLHLDRDTDLILSRILEQGNSEEINWATRHYSLKRRRAFLRTQGDRLLTPRTRNYWSWLWGVRTASKSPEWRKIGQKLGGIS